MMVDTRLPEPSGSFRWTQADGRPALVCAPLEPFAQHLYTTRQWPLGSAAVDQKPAAWGDVARALAIEPPQLQRLRQVHRADVVVRRAGGRVPPADPDEPEADIIVSDEASLGLAVQAADCVPLLIADRRTGAVAAAHSGWRGLVASVPRVAVDALVREFGSRPHDLVAAAGPSIGPCCYEVGADLRAEFEAAGFSHAQIDRWFHEQAIATAANPPMTALTATCRPDRCFLDLWIATRDQLRQAGVPGDQVHLAHICTASHPDTLCSYRRDGATAGRLAGAIRPRRSA